MSRKTKKYPEESLVVLREDGKANPYMTVRPPDTELTETATQVWTLASFLEAKYGVKKRPIAEGKAAIEWVRKNLNEDGIAIPPGQEAFDNLTAEDQGRVLFRLLKLPQSKWTGTFRVDVHQCVSKEHETGPRHYHVSIFRNGEMVETSPPIYRGFEKTRAAAVQLEWELNRRSLCVEQLYR